MDFMGISGALPKATLQEIAGLIKGLLTIGFPVIQALLGAYFLGGMALGGYLKIPMMIGMIGALDSSIPVKKSFGTLPSFF